MAFLQDKVFGPLNSSRPAQILAYGGLSLLVVWVLLSRVIGNLPDVMGDELVYATAALRAPMSTASIPDYLYYWVYSSTGVCGIGFYGCSQVLNTVFSLGAGLLVLVIARRFISQWASVMIALIFVLGPLSASNSYFMPESMYYFFLALLFWHLSKQVSQRSLGFWIQAGVYLALLSLVKPHALLLVPGVGTYLLVTQWGDAAGRWVRLIKEGGSFLVSLVVVKMGLGLIFAGPAGLTFFGNSYSATLNNTLTGAGSAATTATSTAATAAANGGSSFADSIGFVFNEIGIEVLAVVFLGALPLAAAIRYLLRSRNVVAANRPLADFTFLIVNSLAWMVLLIAIFSNMTRLSGEDTTNRIMLRYFEFLIPLLLVTLVAAAEKNQTIKSGLRWTFASLGSVLVIVAGVYITGTQASGAQRFNLQFVDSPMLKVLAGTSTQDSTGKTIFWMSIVVMVLTILALLVWASNPRWGAVGWVAVVTPVLLILSNTAMVNNYAWRSTYTMASDTAGEFVRDSIPAGELANLVVVAPSDTNKSELVTKFHLINVPGADAVQTQTVNEGATYNAPAADTNIKWELALGNVVLSDAGYVVAQAGGVELLRRDLSDVQIFNNHSHAGVLLNNAAGLGAPNAQGECATVGVVTLNLNKPIQSGDKVVLGLTATGYGSGQSYGFQIGDYTQSFGLPNAQRPVYVELHPTNSQAASAITINLPQVQGAGLCLSYLSVGK